MADRNPGSFTELVFASLVDADFIVGFDVSETESVRIAAQSFRERLLSTSTISHLAAMAAIGSIDLAADEFIMRDATTGLFVRLPAEQIIGRILNRANITGLSNLSLMTSVDPAADRFLVWDATVPGFVTITASALTNGLEQQAISSYTSTPTTVTASAQMQGEIISNNGASQIIRFELPSWQAGLRYTFQRIANYAMRLAPQASDPIADGVAGKYLEMQSTGRISLRAIVSGRWDITNDGCVWDWEL